MAEGQLAHEEVHVLLGQVLVAQAHLAQRQEGVGADLGWRGQRGREGREGGLDSSEGLCACRVGFIRLI